MYRRILVPVDGSNSSNRALKEAMRLAHGRQTKLRIVHVVDAIVNDAVAWRADVVVMGTHGRRGLNRLLLGSVADGVV